MEIKKLTCYDLMVGDWVNIYNFIDGKQQDLFPAKVVSIFQGSELENYNIVECIYGNNISSRPVDTCLPIPITTEILEKNGWIHYEEDKDSFHDKSCVFLKQKAGGYGVCIDNVRTISGIIHYIHELQHALQLCGIDKEIVL